MPNVEDKLDCIPTPSYVIEEKKLIRNLEILDHIRQEAGCKVIGALKAFAMYSLFPIMRPYLDGVTASSLNEALLGREEFGKEVHLCTPAYLDSEINNIIDIADHLTFNSISQYKKHIGKVKASDRNIEVSLRLNPEYSEVNHEIYDPCRRYSRLGITKEELDQSLVSEIEGFHFHTMCEKYVDSLERTLKAAEEKFGEYFHQVKWVNFGGGQRITRENYRVDRLIELIKQFQDKYNVTVILEPGEAVAYNTGVLVASVVDLIRNEKEQAILDTSASTHMPDIIEMPYVPDIMNAGGVEKYAYQYQLGGCTCLAGDTIGEFSFKEPLEIGQKLIFQDMGHYTMVKNTTFNGINLPSIGCLRTTGEFQLIRQFGYEDFKSRLS